MRWTKFGGAIIPLAVSLLLASPMAAADTYDIDPEHTEVRFTWDHLGLSRQGGRFVDVKGTLTFDQQQPGLSTVEVEIPLEGLRTGVAKLDEHLLNSREFFDVKAHPSITFKSTGVQMKSDRTGQVTGDLAMNGVARPVVLDVVWNFTGEHPLSTINPVYAGIYASGFSATTQLRRSDWGLTRTIPFVSDEIRISIETELHRRALPLPVEPAAADRPGAVIPVTPPPDPGPEVPLQIPTLPDATP